MSRKNQMLLELDTFPAIFMSFVQKKSNHSLFLFFEGKDDGKYYYPRVSHIFNGASYEPIICGCKKNLIQMQNAIKQQTSTKNIATLYFVDRDYDDNSNLDCDIYVTPTYSIENLYFTDRAILAMLQVELGISILDDDKQDFEVAFFFLKDKRDKLIKSILYANAVYSLQIRKSSNSRQRGPDMSAIQKCKDIMGISKFEQIKDKINDYIELKEDEINEELLRLESDSINLIRGKYLLEMMPSYIKSLLTELNQNGFKKQRKIKLDICKTNLLSNLSSYAETPESLIKYIDERYRQWCSNLDGASKNRL